jgi:hypothetical protein
MYLGERLTFGEPVITDRCVFIVAALAMWYGTAKRDAEFSNSTGGTEDKPTIPRDARTLEMNTGGAQRGADRHHRLKDEDAHRCGVDGHRRHIHETADPLVETTRETKQRDLLRR